MKEYYVYQYNTAITQGSTLALARLPGASKIPMSDK